MDERSMTQQFEQSSGVFRRSIEFGPYGLLYRNKSLGAVQERSVLYEELVMDRIVKGVHIEFVPFVLTLVFATISATVATVGEGPLSGVLFWALVAVVSGVYCWLRSGRYVDIPVIDAAPIRLFGTRPSEEEVSRMLNALKEHAKAYVVRKFGPIKGQGTQEEHGNRLRWLRDRNFISDDELEERLREFGIEGRFRGAGPIGF